MAESRAEKKKREEAEYDAECQRRDAAKAKSEAERIARDLREQKNNAEGDREQAQQMIDARDSQIEEHEAEISRLNTEIDIAKVELDELKYVVGALVENINTALVAVTRGPTSAAKPVLQGASDFGSAFLGRQSVTAEVTGVVPCDGRGLLEPSVSFTPTAKGLLIRVEDSAIAEFWMTIMLSETRLMRAASQVHQLARPHMVSAADTIT